MRVMPDHAEPEVGRYFVEGDIVQYMAREGPIIGIKGKGDDLFVAFYVGFGTWIYRWVRSQDALFVRSPDQDLFSNKYLMEG